MVSFPDALRLRVANSNTQVPLFNLYLIGECIEFPDILGQLLIRFSITNGCLRATLRVEINRSSSPSHYLQPAFT